MIELTGLTAAAEEGWGTLLDLAEIDTTSWLLVGGQMTYLLAVEHGAADRVRPTDDVDVVVDVHARPRGTEWLSRWLAQQGFELEGVSPDHVGHRFARPAVTGPGRVVFDVLAPEGLGRRTAVFTLRPARTVQAPGSMQAIRRSELVRVSVSGLAGGRARRGAVRRPNLLGALVAKAAATGIGRRQNPDRDWQDAALLLSLVPDPPAVAAECDRKDRRRLRRLEPLADRDHAGWATLDDDAWRRGAATLSFLTG